MSALSTVVRRLRQHYGVIEVRPDDPDGLTPDQVRYLVRSGVLERVLDGAYRLTSHPLDERARCAAVSLARPLLTIAGPTAGRLWELRRSPRGATIHVIAPRAAQPCRAAWVEPYRTDALDPVDIEQRPDGIRITSARRTALDLTRFIGWSDLRSMIEDGIHRQLFTADDLLEVATPLATPGRPWVKTFIRAVEGRGRGPAAESHWEDRVFRALGRRLDGLARQVAVDLPGYGRARFDLAIPSIRWALEIDVHPSHHDHAGVLRDKRRDRAASRAGWQVSRVGEPDLRAHFQRTVDELVAIARQRSHDPDAA